MKEWIVEEEKIDLGAALYNKNSKGKEKTLKKEIT